MFSQRLKELRLEKKLYQSQLAKELNVDRTTVVKWEKNEQETDFATLIKIADFFDVSIDFLLGRKDY
ncbi:MAG: helix-turn-helix transcriptional regulator [Clostridia bacterium]|nr:helix-turn-helix transcriptional regulator [Clostridia bacterium]